MALAARLRVVEGAEAIGDGFCLLKLGLIGDVCGVVDHAISFIVKTGWSFWKRRSKQDDRKHQQGQAHEEFHRRLEEGWLVNGRPILAKAGQKNCKNLTADVRGRQLQLEESVRTSSNSDARTTASN